MENQQRVLVGVEGSTDLTDNNILSARPKEIEGVDKRRLTERYGSMVQARTTISVPNEESPPGRQRQVPVDGLVYQIRPRDIRDDPGGTAMLL